MDPKTHSSWLILHFNIIYLSNNNKKQLEWDYRNVLDIIVWGLKEFLFFLIEYASNIIPTIEDRLLDESIINMIVVALKQK